MNKFDQYTKVDNIIESCLNKQHVKMCEGIVLRFQHMYHDKALTHNLYMKLNTFKEKHLGLLDSYNVSA